MTRKKAKQKMFSFLRKRVGHKAACQIKAAFSKANGNLMFHFQDYLDGQCFYTRGNEVLVNAFYSGENLLTGMQLRMEFSLRDEDRDKLLVSATKHYHDSRDDYEYYVIVDKKGK